MSQFSFLEAEFTDEFAASSRAEKYALEDPGTSVIHARRALESAVKWAFKNDPGLRQPYDCLLYTSPSPRDRTRSRMPSSA